MVVPVRKQRWQWSEVLCASPLREALQWWSANQKKTNHNCPECFRCRTSPELLLPQSVWYYSSAETQLLFSVLAPGPNMHPAPCLPLSPFGEAGLLTAYTTVTPPLSFQQGFGRALLGLLCQHLPLNASPLQDRTKFCFLQRRKPPQRGDSHPNTRPRSFHRFHAQGLGFPPGEGEASFLTCFCTLILLFFFLGGGVLPLLCAHTYPAPHWPNDALHSLDV